MDKISPAQRSANMRRIRSVNTTPEIATRSLIHRLGYRFRLHRKDLPGRPDIVFASRQKVIFVHGCFWHQHSECREGRIPGSRSEYWLPKLQGNKKKDAAHRLELERSGWGVLEIWECQCGDEQSLAELIKEFLGPTHA
ncbi:MAG: DNA mismatch endonuclease Vsr [Terracidiphilus sp.]|jgi:DNA mismatch endonuclease (patch repair protein)